MLKTAGCLYPCSQCKTWPAQVQSSPAWPLISGRLGLPSQCVRDTALWTTTGCSGLPAQLQHRYQHQTQQAAQACHHCSCRRWNSQTLQAAQAGQLSFSTAQRAHVCLRRSYQAHVQPSRCQRPSTRREPSTACPHVAGCPRGNLSASLSTCSINATHSRQAAAALCAAQHDPQDFRRIRPLAMHSMLPELRFLISRQAWPKPCTAPSWQVLQACG